MAQELTVKELVEMYDRSIGVAEIWFVDQQRKQVQVLCKREEDYIEQVLSEGVMRCEVVEGFWLEVGWLFAKPLPLELGTLMQLLGGQ